MKYVYTGMSPYQHLPHISSRHLTTLTILFLLAPSVIVSAYTLVEAHQLSHLYMKKGKTVAINFYLHLLLPFYI